MNCFDDTNNMASIEDTTLDIYKSVYNNLDIIIDKNITSLLDPKTNKIYNKINYMNQLSKRDTQARTLTMIYMGLLLVNYI